MDGPSAMGGGAPGAVAAGATAVLGAASGVHCRVKSYSPVRPVLSTTGRPNWFASTVVSIVIGALFPDNVPRPTRILGPGSPALGINLDPFLPNKSTKAGSSRISW